LLVAVSVNVKVKGGVFVALATFPLNVLLNAIPAEPSVLTAFKVVPSKVRLASP
jgi:hypothetical protein